MHGVGTTDSSPPSQTMRDWIRKLLEGFFSWVTAGVWWLFDRLYGDAIFEWLRPMIPDWAASPTLDRALSLGLSFGPPIILFALGAFFLWRGWRKVTRSPGESEARSTQPRLFDNWGAQAQSTQTMEAPAMTEKKVGDESVVIGDVKHSVGNKSVVIGPTDNRGNTILNQGPLAVGHGAQAGPGSIAIGTNAGAGLKKKE